MVLLRGSSPQSCGAARLDWDNWSDIGVTSWQNQTHHRTVESAALEFTLSHIGGCQKPVRRIRITKRWNGSPDKSKLLDLHVEDHHGSDSTSSKIDEGTFQGFSAL